MMLQPVILAGGSGTRLWPLSRELYPKQLLPLVGEHTMLQETISRLEGLGGDMNLQDPLVICNEEHRFLVAEQIRQLGKQPQSIILEPIGRNTAPALTLAALSLMDSQPDAIMFVMPADHVIRDGSVFHKAIANGMHQANAGYLVTFGIVATAPETGYGYIRAGEKFGDASGASKVDAFVEKPDENTAQKYLDSGEYYWNSGMFMMKASVWLDEMAKYRPDIVESCKNAWNRGSQDQDFYRVDKELFTACPSDSIDYAVMEKATQEKAGKGVVVIPLDAGWSDVGAWSSLWEISEQDAEGNVLRGDVYAHNTRDTLCIADSRCIAAVGLSDLVVVETADAVMVAHKDHAQDVKEIVNRLKSDDREESRLHRRVYRPWGSYEGIDAGDRFQVKRIIVNPGAALSLQMHHHRAEHWIIVKGTAQITRDEEVFMLSENESTYIPIGAKHRLENPGKFPLEMIEVQSGSYLGEDDIVRYEDVYGRTDDK